jgi:tight adherence protein C
VIENPILLVFLGAIVFTLTGAAAYGMYRFITPTRTASDRLRDLAQGERNEVVEIVTGGNDQSNPFMEQLARLASPTSDEDRNRLRERLIQAGYRNRRAPDMFNAARVTAAVCIPLLLTPVLSGFSLTKAAIAIFVAAAAGYYGPFLLVSNMVETRKAMLLKSFPDSLDLLVSSVEAGLGLDAAFRRVAQEMESASPDLAREYQVVNHEIGAGVPRVQAMKHLEQRTGLEEVRSLVNMLSQAERFGSSIAKSLRIHSKMVRQKRMSRAEEEAAKVSPKLTVVMILFLLPVLMVILTGPAGIRVYEALGK